MLTRKGVTVCLWKEFAKAYASNRDAVSELRILLAPTILPMDLLTTTFSVMDSSSFQFLTLINIVNQQMDLDRWMSLCQLKNLRTLLVDTGRLLPQFDDRVAKGWASHAQDSGAFPQLHYFGLCGYQGCGLRRSALEELLALPVLTVIALRGVRIIENGKTIGWRRQQYVLHPGSNMYMKTKSKQRITRELEQPSQVDSSLVRLYAHMQSNWPSSVPATSSPQINTFSTD